MWERIVDAHVHLPGIVGLPKKSMVLTEKIREVDKTRLLDYVGMLDPMSMARVDRALKYTLSIGREKKNVRQNQGDLHRRDQGEDGGRSCRDHRRIL